MEMKTHCDTDIFYSGVSVEIRRFKRGRGEVGAVTADFGADVETFRKEERRAAPARGGKEIGGGEGRPAAPAPSAAAIGS